MAFLAQQRLILQILQYSLRISFLYFSFLSALIFLSFLLEMRLEYSKWYCSSSCISACILRAAILMTSALLRSYIPLRYWWEWQLQRRLWQRGEELASPMFFNTTSARRPLIIWQSFHRQSSSCTSLQQLILSNKLPFSIRKPFTSSKQSTWGSRLQYSTNYLRNSSTVVQDSMKNTFYLGKQTMIGTLKAWAAQQSSKRLGGIEGEWSKSAWGRDYF